MTDKFRFSKGYALEELLRAYFLRAGFFVMRGIPFSFLDENLGDVDLWLYDRPTGTSRRVQFCDIKFKNRPKAVERIFWTNGLSDALKFDGAYVATTDKRKNIRLLASKLDIQLIDGIDIQRIRESPNVLYTDRISDELLLLELKIVDDELKNKNLQDTRLKILSALSVGFGAPSAVRALDYFSNLAREVVHSHPDSKAARAAGRLTYLAAAVICESLDYVSIGAAFRTLNERRELILNAVRHGVLSDYDGQQTLRLALALVEKYAPGGSATARDVEAGFRGDLERIPAEIIADQAVKLLTDNNLFHTGLNLEKACYSIIPPPFDCLGLEAKSMLGALLDYSSVDRKRFAQAWKAKIDSSSNDETSRTMTLPLESGQP